MSQFIVFLCKVGGTGGAKGGYSLPKNCTVGLSSAHYVLPSAVCKSFSPPNLILLPPPLFLCRNLIGDKTATDPSQLARVVEYMRRQVQHMDHLDSEQLMTKGNITLLPLK